MNQDLIQNRLNDARVDCLALRDELATGAISTFGAAARLSEIEDGLRALCEEAGRAVVPVTSPRPAAA
jgi:aspartate 1-decarboxylase